MRWNTINTPGERPDGRREVVDLVARVDREPHGDQRLQRPAERREVDLGVEAADHPALPE